jgi:hypothetical protein
MPFLFKINKRGEEIFVMKKMQSPHKKSGKEAYDEIKKIRPDVKAPFTSGYAIDIIKGKGLLEEGFNFISKPILPKELITKVREL